MYIATFESWHRASHGARAERRKSPYNPQLAASSFTRYLTKAGRLRMPLQSPEFLCVQLLSQSHDHDPPSAADAACPMLSSMSRAFQRDLICCIGPSTRRDVIVARPQQETKDEGHR